MGEESLMATSVADRAGAVGVRRLPGTGRTIDSGHAGLASINISVGGSRSARIRRRWSRSAARRDGHDHAKQVLEQAISLLDLELLEAIAAEHDLDLVPGSLGENLRWRRRPAVGEGDRLAIHPDREDPVV